jgi:hypothetical protein
MYHLKNPLDNRQHFEGGDSDKNNNADPFGARYNSNRNQTPISGFTAPPDIVNQLANNENHVT